MTIIQPNKAKNLKKVKLFAGLTLIVFLASAYLSISFYSGIVKLRHELVKKEQAWRELGIKNAEFKNQLYALLDSKNMRQTAGILGLTIDKKPNFIEVPEKNSLVKKEL